MDRPEAQSFDAAFARDLDRLFRLRRDVRRFRPDPVAPDLITALIDQADRAPSVGLSQPWRFVTIDDPVRRAAVRDEFERCNRAALDTQAPEHRLAYGSLKLAGLDQAPVQIAVFVEPDPAQGRGLGRRTMPETLAYSAVMAIHTFWLAARAEGLGLGWVSILDPEVIHNAIDVPAGWRLIAYLCVGYPEMTGDVPELESLGWDQRRSPVRLRR